MNLDHDARALLEALRVEETPSAAATERGWAAISTELGAELTVVPVSAAKVGAGWGAWIASTAAAVGLAVGIPWLAGGDAAKTPTAIEAASTPTAVAIRPTPEPTPTESFIPPPAELPAISPPETARTQPAKTTRRRAKSGPRLGPELALMRRARAKLAADDAAGALRLLARHAREFPAGVLAEERDVSRIAALCELERSSDARRHARTYLAEHAGSALAARVRQSCAVP